MPLIKDKMIDLLIRKYVKDYNKPERQAVKTGISLICAYTGIGLNILLFIAKYSLGLMIGSISMVADAFNNLGDIASASATAIGYKFASKGADDDHPFGHGRIDWVVAIVIGIAIVLTGFELLKKSIGAILNSEEILANAWSISAMGIAVLIKIYIYSYNKKYAKITGLHSMNTTALDSLSDIVASSGVLISLLIAKLAQVNIDGYVGLLVSSFVMYSGIKSIFDVLNEFIGTQATDSIRELISNTVLDKDENISIHDFFIHDYGFGNYFASMHIDVPSDYDHEKLKQIISDVNYELYHKTGYRVSIQVDYKIVDELVLSAAKQKLSDCLSSIDEGIHISDFRMLESISNCNVEFDLIIPAKIEGREKEIIAKSDAALKQLNPEYRCLPYIKYSKIKVGQHTL